MPNATIKSYAVKYDISEKEVEKIWNKAKSIVEKEYGQPKEKAHKNTKNRFFGTLTKIFKNMINKKYGKTEILRFKDFEIKS